MPKKIQQTDSNGNVHFVQRQQKPKNTKIIQSKRVGKSSCCNKIGRKK